MGGEVGYDCSSGNYSWLADIGDPAYQQAFIAGAESIGIPRTTDFNNATQEGAGYYQLTTKNGWRCSAAGSASARNCPSAS